MNQQFRLALGIGLALLTTAAPAHAASTLVFTAVPVDGSRPLGPQGRVYAGSQSIMTIGGHGAQSAADAVEVARRLNALAEAGLRPEEITVRKTRGLRTILGRGQPIVQIDQAQAKAQMTDPAALARTWVDNLADQFGRPYLSVSPVVVPVGEVRSTTVRGNVVGSLRVEADAPLVTAAYDPKTRTIRVTGLAVGRTELVLADEESALRLPVRSAKYAARVSGTLVAGVTGNPASTEVIYRAAQAAVASSLALEPGAWATIDARTGPVSPLPSGATRAVKVHLSAAGEEYLPYRAEPVVTVRSETVTPGPADVLMVSNSPERLLSQGLWYEGSLAEVQSARLLYHHVNSSRVPGDFVVELWNVADQAVRVQVIAGSGGPSRDEAYAGHRAASQFLANRAGNVGWIVSLPAKTAVPVVSHDMDPGSIVSGMAEVRKLGAGDVRVRCYLSPRRSAWLPYAIRSYEPGPLLGRWTYPNPRQEVNARYVVGRDWAFVTIGDQPVSGLAPGDQLAGNYGVIYDIGLELINPTDRAAVVELAMEPGGGTARAVLLIDGRPVDAGLLRGNSEARLARYVLGSGELRTIQIQTTPQGGSNYPVRLFARAP
ncbi:MAG: hypothetical protein ACE149_14685 [Armatimonadota bacterium]